MNKSMILIICLLALVGGAYSQQLIAEGLETAQQVEPTPTQAIYLIEPATTLLMVGETTDVKISLLTAEGCGYGGYILDVDSVGEDGYESDILQRIDEGSWPIHPKSNSTWQAMRLGKAKIIANSFGEGACSYYPGIPPPFFNANASGSSREILIVDEIFQTFLPTVSVQP